MKKTLLLNQLSICFISILFFGLFQSSFAQTYNWVGSVSTDFYDVNNWDNTAINFAALNSANLVIGIGTPNSPVNIGHSGNDVIARRPASLTTNVGANVVITKTFFPAGNSILNGIVTVEGSANFNSRNAVYIGNTAQGTLSLNAGNITSKNAFYIGNGTGGKGLVTVNGGSLWAGTSLEIGTGATNPIGNLNIVGGTINIATNLNIGTNGSIYISGLGQILVTGDKRTALQNYINNGKITCPVSSTLSVTYDGSKTSVIIYQDPNRMIQEFAGYIILKNGIIEAKIEKGTSNLISMKVNGVETLYVTTSTTRTGGYYDFVTSQDFETIYGATFTIKEETADYIDVSFFRPYKSGANNTRCDVDIHYVIKKGDSGIYTYSILNHKAAYPDFDLGSWRQVLWTDSAVTDRICVNDLKTWDMPVPGDTSSPTSIPEIIKIESGVRAGKYDGKYQFSEPLYSLKAYGHSSNKRPLGIWAVTGNHEYFSGGPTSQDLNSAAGIIHVLMNGVHYNSIGFQVKQGEDWSKIYGPYLIYANQYANATANWEDAKTRADQDKLQWPFAWLTNTPDYPLAAGRGNITGNFAITDPSKPEVNGGNAWIGVTILSPDSRGNWQFEEKNYQYWVQTDASGNFDIKNIRPGTYTLFAYKDGTTGEYRQETIVVVAASTTILGNINWNIPRVNGNLVFEIGVPNRTASEYKFGDFDYCEGFVENKFATTFTNPIEYNVEDKNWATALPYVQSAYFNTDATRSVWDWNVNFNLTGIIPNTGNAKLTIAYASSDHAQNWIFINGSRVTPSSGYYPPNGGGNAFLRQSNHAKYGLATFDIPYSKLKSGKNTLKLQMPSTSSGSNHVMYDYISLEGSLTTLGVNSDTIIKDSVSAYPNPTKGIFEIALPLSIQETTIGLYTIDMKLISNKTYIVTNGKVQLNIENQPKGIYFAKVGSGNSVTLKIIKE